MAFLFNVYVAIAFGLPISEPSIRFTPGFPLAVPGTGVAVVHGRAKAKDGFVLQGAKVTYFPGGMVAETQHFVIDTNGDMSPVFIMGLKRGVEYFVMLDVMQCRGKENLTYRTISRVIAR